MTKKRIHENKAVKSSIKENEKPQSLIKETCKPESKSANGIIVNFACPFAFYSCRIKNKFTNYVKDSDFFNKCMKIIFCDALQYFSNDSFEKFASDKSSHIHIVDNDHLEIISKIIAELIKNKNPNVKKLDTIVDNYMDGDIWQLAYKDGIRLIGSRNDNIFNLFFIDYHHLVYPDTKHNNKDYYNFKYNPL